MNTRFQQTTLTLTLLFGVDFIHAQAAPIVPPKQVVGGMTQAEWSRAWWQWAGSFERNDSPVADQTGELCAGKQKGPVWFLAGTYGSRRTIRTCKIPSGKFIFFPLVNYVVMPRGDSPNSCKSVTNTAARITDDASALILDVDGARIPDLMNYRQATTKCFDMGALTSEKVRVFPSAANGYYVMLRPLSAGKHVINFGGMLPSVQQAITYTLDVE
jgi:hypothetical protein